MSVRLTRLRLACFVALSLLGLTACRTAVPSARPAPAPPPPRPTPGLFLYEVQSAAGTAHLLGTIHLGFGFDEVLTPDARRRFEASERVMTEADIGSADPETLVQAALLPPERSLRKIVGPDTWQKLVARLGKQIPPPMLERLEPWLPAVMLGMQDLEEALAELKPGAQTRLMDLELTKQATALGKSISHFETVAEQIALFDTITLEEQVRELAQELTGESSDNARSLLTAFAAGDEQALARALFDEEQQTLAPGFYERVLYGRNERWLPVIERETTRGGAFIAVGAAHLLGPRGIVEELRKRGYRVTRVMQ